MDSNLTVNSVDFQEKVINFLNSINFLRDEDNRTNLLRGIPLTERFIRGKSMATDIEKIVRNVAALGKSSPKFGGKYYLQIMLENSREFIADDDQLKTLESFLQELDTSTFDGNDSLFVNREHEISEIDSPPVYYLIDAPDGYGKTLLLHKLQRLFAGNGWSCAYVTIDQNILVSSVVEDLAIELGLKFSSNSTKYTPKTYGERLGASITAADNKKRVFLLLDFEDEPNLRVFESLINDVIPDLYDTLSENGRSLHTRYGESNRKISQIPSRSLGNYENKNPMISLRVVIAGRHLSMTKERQTTGLPLKDVVLTLFDFSIVSLYVEKRYSEISNMGEIAAHLTCLTGGHPASLEIVSRSYQKCAWNYDSLLQKGFEERDLMLDGIYNGLPLDKSMRHFIAELSLFRRLDRWLLSRIPKPSEISEIKNVEDRLTETHLFERQGLWIVNTVVRRVLVLWLQRTTSKYVDMCRQAMTLYLEGLAQAKREPEMWVIEYLFQCLQTSIGTVHTPEQRTQIRGIFWEQNLPLILRIYLEADSNIDYAKESLKSRIDMDWEFKFMVNYYLMSANYTDEPLRRLYDAIDKFDPKAECTAS